MAQGGDGRIIDRDDNQPDEQQPVSPGELRSIITRIERFESERQEIAADIRKVKLEAKAKGFDTKVINFLIRERRQDRDELEDFNTQVEVYRSALDQDL